MASAPATIDQSSSIPADSKMGLKVLSEARRVEEAEEDFTWVSGFSIKFQGCHHVSQWNDEADGEEDVKVQTKRLVRFRLCPVGTCSDESAGGCSSGYGDYIIDMNVFIEAYMENKREVEEYTCEYYRENMCDCEDGDDKDDGFDPDVCESACYESYGLDYCIEEEPADDDGAIEMIEAEEYMECANIDFPDERRRRAEEAEEVEYFLGPYCASSGGKIYLGLFTDDTCTTFADEYGGKNLFASMAGYSLPYSAESLIGPECASCMEPKDVDEQNQNDVADEDEVKEYCLEIYKAAGKCEKDLYYSSNQNACVYMKGIKITRSNGVIIAGASNKNKVASAFTGIFAVSFVLLGAYVYYLKTKLDRAKINLSD
eukprot:CAMPEP_0184854704 /NCGR_PEP_ID=MMETSP0580-20130426/78_1 /TAXON_ID=1118495 /ORGANISM="Dactyliosolen fragilissimus" /LENGTH=371 /DNA_ID=CAMNT_0027349007 /DNA_START=78 /DNA_END=1193 /DNA_ORIENTATION=-